MIRAPSMLTRLNVEALRYYSPRRTNSHHPRLYEAVRGNLQYRSIGKIQQYRHISITWTNNQSYLCPLLFFAFLLLSENGHYGCQESVYPYTYLLRTRSDTSGEYNSIPLIKQIPRDRFPTWEYTPLAGTPAWVAHTTIHGWDTVNRVDWSRHTGEAVF